MTPLNSLVSVAVLAQALQLRLVMSGSPEGLNVRDRQMQMAQAALRKVTSLIRGPEPYRRDDATETLMKVFQVVNDYVGDMMAFQAVDEALEETQQQPQQHELLTQLPIAASPASEDAAATSAAADDSQL